MPMALSCCNDDRNIRANRRLEPISSFGFVMKLPSWSMTVAGAFSAEQHTDLVDAERDKPCDKQLEHG